MTATATPPDTPEARSVITAIERGEVNGASFAFEMIYDEKGRPLGERWVEEPGEGPLRELLDAIIWDVSPVVFPAYSDSDTEVKEDAHRVYTEYRKAHPAPDQVETAPGDTNPDDDDQVADVDQRTLELAALGARYNLP
jgi:phage head maturation protease